jgi:hypothetical protein
VIENITLWLFVALGIWSAPAIIVGVLLLVAMSRRPARPPEAQVPIGDPSTSLAPAANDLVAGRGFVGAAPKSS